MPLERIASATAYSALELVQAATATVARAEASIRAPVTGRIEAAATAPRQAADPVDVPAALQSRADRLGRNLDVIA
jgi:hypothetical protein